MGYSIEFPSRLTDVDVGVEGTTLVNQVDLLSFDGIVEGVEVGDGLAFCGGFAGPLERTYRCYGKEGRSLERYLGAWDEVRRDEYAVEGTRCACWMEV